MLAAVKKIHADKGIKTVTVVGHSLGGAIAIIDAVYFKFQIPGVVVKTVTYGVPRVRSITDVFEALYSFLC